MKKNILKVTILSLFTVLAISCGDKKKSETTDAVEVEETTSDVTTYMADVDGSQIEWEAGKLTGNHTGYLNIAKGYVELNESNEIEGGEFVIDMSTITVTDLEGDGKANLEAHLKGTVEGQEGDFFNINKYPTGNFVVTGMEVADGKTWLQGNLTLLETTRNVKFPVNMSLDGDKMILQSEAFEIDRTEWEINFRSKSIFPNIGDKVIYDDIKLVVYLEADKA
ncbi:MAG: YceI family protein [Flavobacteriaceae bacterium]|nr:YceI family protein [Flavobacteriaceae bacterium]